jgi:hypothetical protein
MRHSKASRSDRQKIERIFRQQCRQQPKLRGARGAIAAFDTSAKSDFERDSGLELI